MLIESYVVEFKEVKKCISSLKADDFIIVTRIEGSKVFFTYGDCKLHVTTAELEEARVN